MATWLRRLLWFLPLGLVLAGLLFFEDPIASRLRGAGMVAAGISLALTALLRPNAKSQPTLPDRTARLSVTQGAGIALLGADALWPGHGLAWIAIAGAGWFMWRAVVSKQEREPSGSWLW